MIRFTNKFLSALLRLFISTPFFMLAIVCVPLLFFDRLLQHRPMDAFLELMRAPLKILFLLVVVVQTLYDGWVIGLATLISTLIPRIRNFFHYEIWTNVDFFFASKSDCEDIINHYEGPVFGRLIRKIIALSFPYEQFKSYEAYHESPHNPDSTRSINAVYNELNDRYERKLWQQATIVEQKINEFLQMRIKKAATPEEIEFAKAAERCHRHFQEDGITKTALDIVHAPKPLITLYMVWMALEEEATVQQAAQLKELLASFMAQIQLGAYRSDNPSVVGVSIEERPECATGAVAILLEVLKLLPNPKYKLTPSKLDSVQRLRELIHLKLNDHYNTKENLRKQVYLYINPSIPVSPLVTEQFKRQAKRSLSQYTRFLVRTPQGNHLLKGGVNLNNEDIQATVDATFDEWRPNP